MHQKCNEPFCNKVSALLIWVIHKNICQNREQFGQTCSWAEGLCLAGKAWFQKNKWDLWNFPVNEKKKKFGGVGEKKSLF